MLTGNNDVRLKRLGQAVVLCGALMLGLSGCGSGADPTGTSAPSNGTPDKVAPAEEVAAEEAAAEEAPAGTSDGLSGEVLVDSIEQEGLECEPLDKDRLRAGVTEQYTCNGDESLVMTVREYENEAARDKQMGVVQDLACEIADDGQEIQRVTTTGNWLVMVGGDRDIDLETFNNSMTTAGLDWTDITCQ